MIAAAHALVGASLAVSFTNPAVGIPLSISSHFLLDLVPHWDWATNMNGKTNRRVFWEAFFDVLAGIVLVFILFRNFSSYYLWIMVFCSQLPDWLESPTLFLGMKKPFSYFKAIQMKAHNRMNLPWGLVVSVIVAILLSLALVSTSNSGFSLASLVPTLTP